MLSRLVDRSTTCPPWPPSPPAGAPARDELLSAERNAAVPALSGPDLDHCLVNEHDPAVIFAVACSAGETSPSREARGTRTGYHRIMSLRIADSRVLLASDRGDRQVPQFRGNAAVPRDLRFRDGHGGGAPRQSHRPVEGVAHRLHRSEGQCSSCPTPRACYTADDAVRTARLAREVGLSNWIKLEVIGDPETLFPDTEGLLEATRDAGQGRVCRAAIHE